MNTPLPYNLIAPSVGTLDDSPVWALESSGDSLYISGKAANGKSAIFKFYDGGSGDWYAVNDAPLVALPGLSSITSLGTLNGTPLVGGNSGSSNILYSVEFNNTGDPVLSTTFGSSGKITATAGYTFQGDGSFYYSSTSTAYTTTALFTATSNKSGVSVLLAYQTKQVTAAGGYTTTVPTSTQATTFGVSGVITAPSGYTFTGGVNGSFGISYSDILVGALADDGSSALIVFNAKGSLDKAYGSEGVIAAPYDITFNRTSYPTHLQSGGYLIAGNTSDGTNVVTKYTGAGQLDDTFGTGGYFSLPSGYNFNNVAAIGDNLFVSFDGSNSGLLAYDASGNIINTFGNNGELDTPSSEYSFQTYGVAALSDGGYLLPASYYSFDPDTGSSSSSQGFFRTDSSGNLDYGLGTNGYVEAPSGYNFEFFDNSATSLEDGSLLILLYPSAVGASSSATVIGHFLSYGSLDTSFGRNGILSAPTKGYGFGGIATLPNNTLLLYSYNSSNSSSAPQYLTYKADGTPATSYGNKGVVSLPSNFYVSGSLLTLSDGSYLVTGTSYSGSVSTDAILHYSAVLIQDTTFGKSGMITAPTGIHFGDSSQLSDGTLLIQGTNSTGSPVLVHYTAKGVIDASFGSNGVLTAPLEGSISFDGSGYTITGSEGNDTLTGVSGATLIGGGGNDLFIVNGSDVVVESNQGGFDTLQSSVSYDLHNAPGINNLIYTGSLGASLTGSGNGGSVVGGSGNDTLSDGVSMSSSGYSGSPIGGSSDGVTLVGGVGTNVYLVNSSNTVIKDASKNSTILTSTSYDLHNVQGIKNLIYTGSGYEVVLNGNAAANLIEDQDRSSEGGNTLIGGAGSDTLVAGAGNDVIFGGNASFELGTANYPSGMTVDSVTAVAGGKILFDGSDNAGNRRFVQYTSAGLPDATFGVGGVFSVSGSTDIQRLGDGSFLVSVADTVSGLPEVVHYTSAGVMDSKLSRGGKVSLPRGVTLNDGAMPLTFPNGSFILQGTNSLGDTVDLNYLPGGKFTASYQDSLRADAFAYLADGSFLVSSTDTHGNPVFTYYLASGKLNTALGKNGMLRVPTMKSGGATVPAYTLNDGDYPIVFANGSFVLRGTDSLSNPVDLHYLAGGKFNAAYQDSLTAGSSTYLADGSFLVEGSDDNGNLNYTHYTAAGKLNTAVGSKNGVLPVPAGVTLGGFVGSEGIDSMFSPQLADGSFLFSGSDSLGNNILVHYTAVLALDAKFGKGGAFVLPEGVTGDQVSVLTDRSVIVRSGVNEEPAITHYLSTGAKDLAFGSDTLGDSLVGGSGNCTLVSGPGVTTMVGGIGNTTFYVNNSADVIKQPVGAGIAEIITSVGFDASKISGLISDITYTGRSGASFKLPAIGTSLIAGPANDTVTGGSGSDTINAFDTLPGGTMTNQIDNITGGPGADLFVLGDGGGSYYVDGSSLNGASSYALITDFGLTDTLQLSSQGQYSFVKASSDALALRGIGAAAKSSDYLLEDLSSGTPDVIAVVRTASPLSMGSVEHFLFNNTTTV